MLIFDSGRYCCCHHPMLCFLHIQMRWEGVYPFSPCLLPHRCDDRGETLFHCVFLATWHNERGLPLLAMFASPVVFPSHRDATRGGFPLLCCVSFQTDTTRGGKPLCHVSFTYRGDRRGESPFLLRYGHDKKALLIVSFCFTTDATRVSPPHVVYIFILFSNYISI